MFARESGALGRAVQIGVASGRVISVSFPESPPDDADADHEVLDRICAYLDGAEEDFGDVEVALTVPTEQRGVLEQLRKVPYGETVTVERLARLAAGIDADEDEGRQAVRSALRENPTPILVPDHRVRDASGATPADVAERLRSVEA